MTRLHTILVNSIGIEVLGEGDWKVKVHRKGRPRKWIKLHIAIDAKTQEILAELTTDSVKGDPAAFPVLFAQINPGVIRTHPGKIFRRLSGLFRLIFDLNNPENRRKILPGWVQLGFFTYF